MPKAKQKQGRRQTKLPHPYRYRRKEDGRPTGTLKRFLFEETKVGFMLKHEVPIVYDIIMGMIPHFPYPEPPYLLIKFICKASSDPSLKKPRFFRYLDEYLQMGLYCKRGKKLTPEREAYYKSIREIKLKQYIKENRDEIARLRLHAVTVLEK